MNVRLSIITPENAHIFRNLQPLYVHDLSAFKDILPNQHGILEPEKPEICDLVEHGQEFGYWYNHEGILYPYLIWVDDLPAGFVLVSREPWVIEGVQNELREFFVLQAYRGRGIAQTAALEAFKLFSGRWGLRILNRNARAIRFWKKTIKIIANDVTESTLEGQVALYFETKPV